MRDQKEVQLKIEKLVLGKKPIQASLQIQKYYHQFGHKNEVLFQCCEWYRRLGLYQKGISLLKINSGNLKIALSTSNKEGRKILWFARLSNLLGASSIARRLIANIHPATSEDHRIFGLIHLTNFSFVQAYQSFSLVCGAKIETSSYQDRINVLNLADAAVGLKKFSEAIELQQKLLPFAASEFERALIQQALGESYCHIQDWGKALEQLKGAFSFYKRTTTNIDLAFLQKWLSLCSFKTGNLEESHSYIEKSIQSLVKLSAKEDALLLSLDFASQFEFLTPQQCLKLKLIKTIFYGGSVAGAEDVFVGLEKATIRINWTSQETQIKYKTKWDFHFGFNKELNLILLLKLFEDWGINYYRVYDLLYSDDPFGIINAKDRIKALIQRLKNIYGLKVSVKGQRLFLAKASAQKIIIRNLDSKPRYEFLATALEKPFKTKDVSNYYLISKTQTAQLLQQWQSENLIVKHGEYFRRTV